MRHRAAVSHGALVLAALAAIIVGFLIMRGVPEPPGLATSHVPRLRWRSALQIMSVVRELSQSVESPGWLAGSDRLWIATGAPPQRRFRTVGSPSDSGAPVPLPLQVSQLAGDEDPQNPVVVVALDEGGSERSRLYAWEPGRDSLTPLTPPMSRLDLCCLDPSGTLAAFDTDDPATGESRVLVADVRRGTVRALASGSSGANSALAWSRDGRWLLIAEQSTFVRATPYVADLPSGRLQRLVPAWGDTVGVSAGPTSRDGRTVFLAADAGSEFDAVIAVDRTSGGTRNLTPGLRHDVVMLQALGRSDTLVMTVNEDGIYRLLALDPRSRARWPLPVPKGYLRRALTDPSAPRVVENVLGADGREAVYVLDVPTGALTRWAVGAPPARTPLPAPLSASYPTFDSVGGAPRQINVVVERPPADIAPPWPVVINLHGGPTEQALALPDARFAAIRRAGIAVLEPNVRGSTGFGKTFAGLDDGRRREGAVRDVGALLDWIRMQRDFDASRVAVVGGSYGGYLSLASLVRYSSRLRCGVDLFGISSLSDFLDESVHGHYPGVQRAEFGDERDPTVRAFLDSISPLTHADRITVPLLIFQGANDPRVKPPESQRMVGRLDSLGRTVWYLTAANEGHGLEHPLNQLYVGTAVLDLLKDYLLPRR